mmetsp:Transcript_10919/g.19453  ORF Transcript_10919/g.19453 Transcript_10919/m.19453 type:complete len:219 (-) Transcript_10919:3216-3872(-)
MLEEGRVHVAIRSSPKVGAGEGGGRCRGSQRGAGLLGLGHIHLTTALSGPPAPDSSPCDRLPSPGILNVHGGNREGPLSWAAGLEDGVDLPVLELAVLHRNVLRQPCRVRHPRHGVGDVLECCGDGDDLLDGRPQAVDEVLPIQNVAHVDVIAERPILQPPRQEVAPDLGLSRKYGHRDGAGGDGLALRLLGDHILALEALVLDKLRAEELGQSPGTC